MENPSQMQQNEALKLVAPQFQQPQKNPQDVMEMLLSAPSIPLSLRQEYFVLWEIIPSGNYDAYDIQWLMLKFEEWAILLEWYIPEQRWGNVLNYKGDMSTDINIDLSVLLNQLKQLYFVQLTRGKEGFTVKEIGTRRAFVEQRDASERKQGGFKWI
jgi:hypothetical protein